MRDDIVFHNFRKEGKVLMCEVIDYGKPIRSNLDDGNRKENIKKILRTKPKKYDADKKIKEAIKELRKQGLEV